MAGIYALVSFTLARRTREIGIRFALGAAPRRIITDTFSRPFAQVGLGVILGVLPGVALMVASNEDTGGMAGPGVGVMLLLGMCVFAVALLACLIPLRRALRIEPTLTFRTD
jgi:ABC-type antimicrobial peptide transport system permease subunit